MTLDISSSKEVAQLLIPNTSKNSNSASINQDFIAHLEKQLNEQSVDKAQDAGSSDLELIKKLKNKLKNIFYDSYNSHSAEDKGKIEKIKKLLKENDSDNSLGLSLDELKAVDTSDGSQFSNFVDDLVTNFKEYDTDNDGQLNLNELVAALPKGEFSAQEVKAITESCKADTSDGISSYLSSADDFLGTVPPVFFFPQLMEVCQNEKSVS